MPKTTTNHLRQHKIRCRLVCRARSTTTNTTAVNSQNRPCSSEAEREYQLWSRSCRRPPLSFLFKNFPPLPASILFYFPCARGKRERGERRGPSVRPSRPQSFLHRRTALRKQGFPCPPSSSVLSPLPPKKEGKEGRSGRSRSRWRCSWSARLGPAAVA